MNYVEQYVGLVDEILLLSGRTDGRDGSWAKVQACTILTKIGLAAKSSLCFIPGNRRFLNEFWDISTLATLSRSIFEAYLLLYYFAVEDVTEEERELRKLAWRLHGRREKLQMLEWINPKSTGIPQVQQEKVDLENQFTGKCSDQKKNNRAFNDKTGLLKNRIDTCADAGISKAFYLGTYKMLCSFTHPTPFGLNFLYNNNAGSPETMEQVEILVQITTGFLALTARDFVRIFPDQDRCLSQQTRYLINHWEFIFSNWESERYLRESRIPTQGNE